MPPPENTLNFAPGCAGGHSRPFGRARAPGKIARVFQGISGEISALMAWFGVLLGFTPPPNPRFAPRREAFCLNSAPPDGEDASGRPASRLATALNLAPVESPAGQTSGARRYKLPADGFVMLAPYGEHPGVDAETGERLLQIFNQAIARDLVTNFDARRAKGEDFFADWDHQSEESTARNTAAAFWPKELQARTDGLYAKGDWTEDGLRDVETGKYRWFSIAWNGQLSGRPGSQPTLRPVALRRVLGALTNDPNMRGIRAVANIKPISGGQVPPVATPTKDTMKSLHKLLGLDENASSESVEAAVRAALNAAAKVPALETQVAALNAKVTATELAPFADLIAEDERAEITAAYNANPTGTLKLLSKLRASTTAKPAPQAKDPLHQVKNAGTPDPKKVLESKAQKRERDQLVAVQNARPRARDNAHAWELAAQENPALFESPAEGEE